MIVLKWDSMGVFLLCEVFLLEGLLLIVVIVAGCSCSPAEDKEPVMYLQLL